MESVRVSRFQFQVLTVLTVCGLGWLLVLTGYKEYWGFWQSPQQYRFLHKEYPLWFRDYVLQYYHAIFWFVLAEFTGWLILALRDLRTFSCASRFFRRVGLILFLTLFLGGILGVRCANNLIGWLDHGKWHGITPLQVHYPRS